MATPTSIDNTKFRLSRMYVKLFFVGFFISDVMRKPTMDSFKTPFPDSQDGGHLFDSSYDYLLCLLIMGEYSQNAFEK
jgi:hypothetical protein